LASLDGLENVTSSLESLRIVDNSSLIDIYGIENISSLGELTIKNNSSLSTCSLDIFCDHIYSGRPTDISFNATGCMSAREIINNCN